MKVVITLVDGFNIITHKIIPLIKEDEILQAVDKLKEQKKTFYVNLFSYNGKCKDILQFEKGILQN